MSETANYAQAFYLAVVQGLTEFLPVSSSGHLILLPSLFGWRDQGLAFDVAVHVGTLIAVLAYLRREIMLIARDCCLSLGGRAQTEYSRLGWFVALASLMIAPVGFFFNDWIEHNLRAALIVAAAGMGFAALLGFADWRGAKSRALRAMGWRDAIVIGLAQILALIPGASRAGVTMSAALALGFERRAAARFSFLLAIPAILFAGILQTQKLLAREARVDWLLTLFAVAVAAAVALACIHLFMRYLPRIGMLPFVIYRFCLGGFLFWRFM